MRNGSKEVPLYIATRDFNVSLYCLRMVRLLARSAVFRHQAVCRNQPTRLKFIMEKQTPHRRLAVVKALVQAGKVRTTHAARIGANELGLRFSDMLQVVMELDSGDFYKSMTTHVDHTIWQDVYRPRTSAGDIYLKLTVMEDVLIVSFKEL